MPDDSTAMLIKPCTREALSQPTDNSEPAISSGEGAVPVPRDWMTAGKDRHLDGLRQPVRVSWLSLKPTGGNEMAEHLPGPWDIYSSEGEIYIGPVNSDERVAVLCDEDEERLFANAFLIAAAPELLTALEAAVAFIDSHVADPDLNDEMIEAYSRYIDADAKYLISKARGI